MSNEDRVLKRAVTIQQGRITGLEARVAEQDASLTAAGEAVRRLEAENYALRHHLHAAESALQQVGSRGFGGGGPGGYGCA